MKSFATFVSLIKKLRSPKGCPWDQKQTIASLLPHLESEVAEIRQAVEKGDYENLQEELGDVLLNLVMISQIASEEKHFTMADVIRGVTRKVTSRHSWVFGKDRHRVKTAEDAYVIWLENKAKEKAALAKKL